VLPTAAEILRLHDESLERWYTNAPSDVDGGTDLPSLIVAQHFCNFALWHLEDEARRRDRGDAYVAEAKRSIDARNQQRHDLIERIDEEILAALPAPDTSSAEQHSETAGMMIDRLSILALKIPNMRALAELQGDADLADKCGRKLETLTEQRGDLADCFDRLMAQCKAGDRYFKVYRQHKVYNDPRLSPTLGSRTKDRAKR
jgi:hypothetical protein